MKIRLLLMLLIDRMVGDNRIKVATSSLNMVVGDRRDVEMAREDKIEGEGEIPMLENNVPIAIR